MSLIVDGCFDQAFYPGWLLLIHTCGQNQSLPSMSVDVRGGRDD
ncbi:MAG: hypothetical protein ACK58N_11005 [Synechocystis sp.]